MAQRKGMVTRRFPTLPGWSVRMQRSDSISLIMQIFQVSFTFLGNSKMIARLTGKKIVIFSHPQSTSHIFFKKQINKKTPQHMNNNQATWFSTWPLAPSGFVFLVTVMKHLLDRCFLHQHVAQVGHVTQRRRALFGLSWICGFLCIKTQILELNPDKHNSLLQPLSALEPSAPARLASNQMAAIYRGAAVFVVPAISGTCCSSTAKFYSWCVPEDKGPFNLSQADAGPRV